MGEEIVKVTSKGQLTIPAGIREEVGMNEGSYIYMKSLGRLVVMKKVNDLRLDDISGIFEQLAKERGLTKVLLTKDIEQVRRQLWKEKYAKGPRPPGQ